MDWVGVIKKEYPDINVTQVANDDFSNRVVNIYGDEHFLPVFGQPYDQTSTTFRSRVYNQIVMVCMDKGELRLERRKFARKLSPFDSIIKNPMDNPENGFYSFDNISSVVAERRELRQWMARTLELSTTLTMTQKNYIEFEKDFLSGRNDLKPLWPSEYEMFISAMELKRAEFKKNQKNFALQNEETQQEANGKTVVSSNSKSQVKEPQALKPASSIQKDGSDKNAEKLVDRETEAAKKYAKQIILDVNNLNLSDPEVEKKLDSLRVDFSAHIKKVPTSDKNSISKRMNENVDGIIGQLIDIKLKELENIPTSIAGMNESKAWKEDFNKTYAPLKDLMAVRFVEQEYERRHTKIIKGAKSEFARKLDSFPSSLAGLDQSAKLLDTVGADSASYKDFLKATLKRIDIIREKMELENKTQDDKFSTQGYNYPAIVKALYHNDLKKIPDDVDVRQYNASLHKVFIGSCGEDSESAKMAALQYWPEQQKTAEKVNPLKAIGRGLSSMKHAAEKDAESGAEGLVSEQAGKKDGELIVRRFDCESPQYKKFQKNLHQIFYYRHKKEPKPQNSQRLQALKIFVESPRNIPLENLKNGCLYNQKDEGLCSIAKNQKNEGKISSIGIKDQPLPITLESVQIVFQVSLPL
jgi:hypothetical protein